MKTRHAFIVALGIATAGGARADDRPLTIEQRLERLEQEQAIRREGKNGDESVQLKLSGLIQTDYRDHLSDANDADRFLLRRVRAAVEGTINESLDFRITPEFASSFQLLDAYGEYKRHPRFKVRAGKFKPPVGLERLQSGAALLFVERAQPTSLVPSRDTGLQIGGDSRNGVLSYQVGVFNGVVDGGSGETDSSDDKDYAARIFVRPFSASASKILSGLGFGVAGTIGDQNGSAAASNLPSFRTNAQQTFFSYAPGTFADGKRKRLVPQAHWFVGSLGILGEYAVSSQEVTRVDASTASATIDNRAYQVALSYVLTGERASFRGVKPSKDFDPANGGWGALELTGRYTELKIDEEAFGVFASAATSAKRVKGWTGGFNWHLNDNAKVVSNYEYTAFTGGAGADRDRRHERAILSRVQIAY